MRKILVALPCLFFSGLVMAKEVADLRAGPGADGVLMATALDRQLAERPLVGQAVAMEAQQKKSSKTAAAKPARAAEPADTSKRFNMTQDGKRMTADDFDAWMKKNGYRVATGAPGKAAGEEPAKGGK